MNLGFKKLRLFGKQTASLKMFARNLGMQFEEPFINGEDSNYISKQALSVDIKGNERMIYLTKRYLWTEKATKEAISN